MAKIPLQIWGPQMPTVLVITSKEVEAICAKNDNMTLAQLLKPLGLKLTNQPMFRSVSRSYQLKQFSVRFVAPEEMQAMENSQAEKLLDNVKLIVPADRRNDNISEREDVPGFFRTTPDPTPWFATYRSLFAETVSYNEAEYLDQPMACVVAVSAEEADALKNLETLTALRGLPRIFQRGHFDSQIYRAYVVVQDGQSQDPSLADKAQRVLASVKKIFAPSAVSGGGGGGGGGVLSPAPTAAGYHIISLNSAKSPSEAVGREPWMPTPSGGHFLLSEEDFKSLQTFTAEFLRAVIPQTERKLAYLHEKVSATRKGFRNQVKLFFGKREAKPKGSSSSSSSSSSAAAAPSSSNESFVRYDLSTGEAQVRQLADLAFVMQDYDLALSSYRLISSDFKQDKEWAHYASTVEWSAVAQGLLEPNNKEVWTTLESAFSAYQSLADDVRRTSRCAMWGLDINTPLPLRLRDAGNLLLKASELKVNEKESLLRSALLVEQAAYTFLLCKPVALLRKYGFYLLMAAHHFHKSPHKINAIRCYSSALSVYEGRGWFHIEDHINLHLGRECYTVGDNDAAIRHFVALIGKRKEVRHREQNGTPGAALRVAVTQTPERQQAFLNEFLTVVSKCSKGSGCVVEGLQLPTFLDHTVQVQLNEDQTVPSAYNVKTWMHATHRRPAMTLDTDLSNKPLFVPSEANAREQDRLAAMYEPIKLKVEVSNPLLIPLSVKAIRLRCVFATPEGEPVDVNAQQVLTLGTLDVELGPSASKQIELTVICQREGVLNIEGITWQVCDIVKGFHPLVLPPKRSIVKGKRSKVVITPNYDLRIVVTHAMPVLRPTLTPMPTHLYQSECMNVSLSLKNTGAMKLEGLRVVVSHPGFIAFQKPQQSTGSEEEAADSEDHSAWVSEGCYPFDWETGVIQLPFSLDAGEEVNVPVCLRGTVIGNQTLGLLFQYHRATPTTSSILSSKEGPPSLHRRLSVSEEFRLTYINYPIAVVPMVGVKVFARSSFAEVGESLVGIEIEDQQDANLSPNFLKKVHFTKVSIMSYSWKISPLVSPASLDPTSANNAGEEEEGPPLSSSPSTSEQERMAAAHRARLSVMSSTLSARESLTLFFRATSLQQQGQVGKRKKETLPSHSWVNYTVTNGRSSVVSSSSTNLLSTPHSPHSPVEAAIAAASSPLPATKVRVPAERAGEMAAQDPTSAPYASLLRTEKAIMVYNERLRVLLNPAAVVADVGARDKVSMVLSWVAGNRFGFIHQTGLTCMQPQPSNCPLRILVDYPTPISHNFAQGPIDVPVKINIRNTLEEEALTFSFEILSPEIEYDASKRGFRSVNIASLTGRYLWKGPCKSRIQQLPPNEVVTIDLHAQFFAPGYFNLNRFRLNIEGPGWNKVYFFPLQYLINILDTTPPPPPTQQLSPAASHHSHSHGHITKVTSSSFLDCNTIPIVVI